MSARRRAGCVSGEAEVIDLFAGAGGWEEALKPLGFRALGVETDPWACAAARAAGHLRLQADVAALGPAGFAPVLGLVASPPCQAFTVCGRRLGWADMPVVVACAHELAAGGDTRAGRLGECRDPRSLLSVEPLRWALALRPRWLAFEQVPAALELWSLLAGLLASHGYQSAVGLLSAERYGVPQTRKRAFLIASLDGPVALPEPTHHAYVYGCRCPSRGALRPYRSMAQALKCEPEGMLHTNNQTHSGKRPRGLCRPLSLPAYTVDTSAGSWTIQDTRITPSQAGAFQGFRGSYPWQGPRTRQFQQAGNAVSPPLARRILAEAMRPTRHRGRQGV
ncbi:MAG TPA: DNA cytosine methyltransferase [Solirubrobacteraceae bacterium]|nr:DNA cytosine methyltransferase [Solirubrobacteraceae bacterium]